MILERGRIIMVRGTISNEYTPATGISSTIVKQLSNSYAVRVLSGPNSLATEINANPNGVRIKGKNIEIDGNTHITNGVIDTAMIKDGAIKDAKIANGTIQNAKIAWLDAGKITGKNANLIDLDAIVGRIEWIFTKGINIGNSTVMKSSNGTLQITGTKWRNEYSTNASIETNGRFYGPTWLYAQATSSNYYTPVMTNRWQNSPLGPGSRRGLTVYSVRGLFLMTFSNDPVNEYGTTAYLYVNDGSNSQHTYYTPLYKNPTQSDWHNGSYTGNN